MVEFSELMPTLINTDNKIIMKTELTKTTFPHIHSDSIRSSSIIFK